MLVFRPLTESFSAKLVLLLFLVAVLVGAIGGFIYLQTGQAVAEETESTMTHATTLQSNTVETWVDRGHDHATAVAIAEPVVSGDRAEIEHTLGTEASRLPPGVDAVHYVDAETGEVLASSADAAGQSYAGTRWMELDRDLPASGDSTVTTTYEDPTIDAPAVAFVATVPGGDHLVVMPVDLAFLQTTLDSASADGDASTHVVNSDGLVVVGHHGQEPNTQNVGPEGELSVDSTAVLRGLDGDVGTVEVERDGEETVMGHAPVEGADWVVMTYVPKEDAYALQTDVQWSVVSLLLVSFLGLALVGIVVGRNTARSLGRLAATAREMEEGNLDVDLQTRRRDEIGQLYGAFDSMRLSLREQIQEARAARDEAEVERERIQAINRELEGAADAYSEVMREAAAGDLTVRMETGADDDAMAAIATEFNEMLAEIERTVEELNAFAAEVATASEEVTASSEEVQHASEQISGSVQEISAGASRQNDSLQSVNREMSDLSTTTEEIAASSSDVADLAGRTADTGEEGREAAQAAIEGMAEIEAESSEAVEAISELEAEVAQVDELVERIQDVAHQTNMLALNANIEASRTTQTSSSDAGFGAVAEEVKELSQDARDTAEEVEERLERIRERTHHSAAEVERTSADVDAASRQVQDAVRALEEIAEYAQETNVGVQGISAATEQQAASTQEVVAMVGEAATISEETTSEAESAAAAAEEQTTALTEVSRSASELSEQAAWLSEALDRFETDADLDGGIASHLFVHATPGDGRAASDAADGDVDSSEDDGATTAGAGSTHDPGASDVDAFQPAVDASDFDVGTGRSSSTAADAEGAHETAVEAEAEAEASTNGELDEEPDEESNAGTDEGPDGDAVVAPPADEPDADAESDEDDDSEPVESPDYVGDGGVVDRTVEDVFDAGSDGRADDE